jgi:hypothetical protein
VGWEHPDGGLIHRQIGYLTNVDALAADFRREESTMSTEMIVWIYMLFILFGWGGFYWIRNR